MLPDLTQPAKGARHEGCVKTFLADIHRKYEEIKDIFEEPVPIIITPDDEENFKNSTICHICEKTLDKTDEKNLVVKDHCHFTGSAYMILLFDMGFRGRELSV